MKIDKELYISIAIDSAAKMLVLIASAHGGVDIEEVPENALSCLSPKLHRTEAA